MKLAYGPSIASAAADPPAPVGRLTPGQREAIVTLFFAGEMDRAGRHFVAEGSEPVTGAAVKALHGLGLAKLGVERTRRSDRSAIIVYRYYVKLTPRGEWYATTLIRQREQNVAALVPDNFEDSPAVYADPPEPEVEEIG